MKTIYSFIAITAFSLGAVAQVDLSANFIAFEEGAEISEDVFDGSISIMNNGTNIPLGDSIYFSYIVDGDIYTIDFENTYSNYYILEEEFVVGTELTFGFVDLTAVNLAEAFSGMNVTFCVAVYGIGPSSVDLTFSSDSYPDDNLECVFLEVPVYGIGVEELALEIGDVYITAGQLMIVNNGIGSGAQANINIVNMSGQLAQNETITLAAGTSTMEVSSLATGIYVVSIQVNGAVINRKISIQ